MYLLLDLVLQHPSDTPVVGLTIFLLHKPFFILKKYCDIIGTQVEGEDANQGPCRIKSLYIQIDLFYKKKV